MCCLFGIIDYGHRLSVRQRDRMLTVLSRSCEARGTDATGIAYHSGGKLRIYKRPLAAHQMQFHLPADAHIIMGHTRMTTQGSEHRNYNNHPFRGQVRDGAFALAHNGVIHNEWAIRKQLHLSAPRIETDSFIAVQLLEYAGALSHDALASMARRLNGTFTITVLDSHDSLYVVRGNNPFCLYHFPRQKLFLYASTADILDRALRKMPVPLDFPEELPLRCGDVLQISCTGSLTHSTFDATHLTQPFSYFHSPFLLDTPEAGSDFYLDDLKSVAAAMGISPAQIDELLDQGFSPEELEEFLYCGEL